ncbi:hypothetical protein SERLA73DRAFT_46650, partial [Serpula lacrymans var. lacrymans S7.3]
VLYFLFLEFAFFRFEIQLILLQNVKDSGDYSTMFLECFCEDHDTVQVHDNFSFRDQFSEEVVHHCLEGCRRVGKSEVTNYDICL